MSGGKACTSRPSKPGLVVQHEGHHHVDLVLDDLALLHPDPLFLDPRAADIPQRLRGASEASLNRVLEALFRSGADLGDLGDRHGNSVMDGVAATRRCRESLY